MSAEPTAGAGVLPVTEARLDRLCIDTIRTLAMDAVERANSGHPGACLKRDLSSAAVASSV